MNKQEFLERYDKLKDIDKVKVLLLRNYQEHFLTKMLLLTLFGMHLFFISVLNISIVSGFFYQFLLIMILYAVLIFFTVGLGVLIIQGKYKKQMEAFLDEKS